LENLKTVVKYDSPFLEFVETRYKDQNGNNNKWYWVRRPNKTEAVAIAAVTHQLKNTVMGVQRVPHLVVIKEFRVTLNDYEYGFPAGLIDPGEQPETAIRREFKEETGLDISHIDEISPAVVSSAGISDESIYLAYASATGKPNKDNLQASEDIETMLLTQQEVAELLKKDVKFGKSAYCVMRTFAKFGEI
jgi:ADP-ribose pyrophosphatase